MRGEKEVEIALAEGKYPVIDTMTDVFAIASAAGKWLYIFVTLNT